MKEEGHNSDFDIQGKIFLIHYKGTLRLLGQFMMDIGDWQNIVSIEMVVVQFKNYVLRYFEGLMKKPCI